MQWWEYQIKYLQVLLELEVHKLDYDHINDPLNKFTKEMLSDLKTNFNGLKLEAHSHLLLYKVKLLHIKLKFKLETSIACLKDLLHNLRDLKNYECYQKN